VWCLGFGTRLRLSLDSCSRHARFVRSFLSHPSACIACEQLCDEALRILRMEPNQLLRVRYLDLADLQSQQAILQSIGIANLSGEQVAQVN
jgi:hypothetical protein